MGGALRAAGGCLSLHAPDVLLLIQLSLIRIMCACVVLCQEALLHSHSPSVKQARLATAQPLCESEATSCKAGNIQDLSITQKRKRKCRQARSDLHEDLTARQVTLALALRLRLRLLLLLVRLPVLPPLPECLHSPEAPFTHAGKYLATFSVSKDVVQ